MSKNLSGRYCVPNDEDYEDGSNGDVLKNYLGFKTVEEISAAEEQELKKTELELINIFTVDHQFTALDICNIHELWLGDIYPSAGKYRTVIMSKDGYCFAAPHLILKLMLELENKYLAKYTPSQTSDLDKLSEAIGIVHVELIIIHPFREGNGRTARLLANMMALQGGYPPIDFSAIDRSVNSKGFEEYILSIHAGHAGDYKPITKIFKKLLTRV